MVELGIVHVTRDNGDIIVSENTYNDFVEKHGKETLFHQIMCFLKVHKNCKVVIEGDGRTKKAVYSIS